MKKTFFIVLSAMIFSTGIFNIAFAAEKVAIVNVVAVVESSTQLKAINKEQQTKMQELEKWLQTAQTDIEKQKTPEGKEKLIKKYNADFARKKETLLKDYQTKLQAVDKNIADAISSQAKLKGYDLVISKGAVLYGGDDITADIQKIIK